MAISAALVLAVAAGGMLPVQAGVCVFGEIAAPPRLGAVLLIAALVAGQSVASLLVDHFGWVGFDEHPISLVRVS